MTSSRKPPIYSRTPAAHRPTWIRQIPPRVFPYAQRSLYFYLCAFEPGTCHLSNNRLARNFHVTTRTIRRWRSWLTAHHLIWTSSLLSDHPEINCHRFNTASEWHSALELTNISAKVSQ